MDIHDIIQAPDELLVEYGNAGNWGQKINLEMIRRLKDSVEELDSSVNALNKAGTEKLLK